MSITITKPTIYDIDQLIPIWEQQFGYHHNLDSYYYVANSEALNKQFKLYLEHSISNDKPYILIAKEADTILGFITYSIEEETYFDTNITRYGSIKELCVDEDKRGKGIGTQLMTAVEDFFASHGLSDICVNSAALNKNAMAFYEKLGYHTKRVAMYKQIESQQKT
jgi:ribosomal protein S18 acetylase RimI-like enzyme